MRSFSGSDIVLKVLGLLLIVAAVLKGHELLATVFRFLAKEPVPKIRFENTRYNFGQIYENEEPVQYGFLFRNIGKQKLTIKKVQKSCGCTEVTCSQQQLEPGELGVVRVIMGILGRYGEIRERIVVHTDDSKQPKILLEIEGFVKHAVRVIPNVVALGPVNPGTIETQELRVEFDRSENPTQITQIFSNLPSIKIRSKDSQSSQEQLSIYEYLYEISTKGNERSSQEEGEIYIQTTHPKAKLLKIPVAIKHAGNLIVSPKCLFLGSVKPNQEIERTLNVVSLDGKPFEISSVLVTGPWVLTNQSVLTLTDNSLHSLKLKFECAQKLSKSFLAGVLTLTTNLEHHYTMTLPVTAFRQQQISSATN